MQTKKTTTTTAYYSTMKLVLEALYSFGPSVKILIVEKNRRLSYVPIDMEFVFIIPNDAILEMTVVV